MRYELIDPTIISNNPWNSNVVSHENEEKLRASLKRNGMFKPIIVRELSDGSVQAIGGEHRKEQAIEIGMTEVPVINLGPISDEKAKEISLADNARYGIDDTLRLSSILEDLDMSAIEQTLPWSTADISAITASLGVDIDDLDLDAPIGVEDDDEPEEAPAPRTIKTHQIVRFRLSLPDAARISNLINATMRDQGFTKEDDLTNAGDALAFLLSSEDDDGED